MNHREVNCESPFFFRKHIVHESPKVSFFSTRNLIVNEIYRVAQELINNFILRKYETVKKDINVGSIIKK